MEDTSEFEIESAKKKLFLVPIEFGHKRLYAREKAFLTCNAKSGTISLGEKALSAMGMANMWYKLAYDSGNRVIAWKIQGGLDKDEMESKAWRFCKKNPQNGNYVMSVGRILDAFQNVKKQSYKHLEIRKYKDPKSLIDDSSYYYIEIPNL